MLFNKKIKPDDYELIKEGSDTVIRINTSGVSYLPSLEDDANCMAITIDKLVENPGITRIVFSDRRNYTYPYDQTEILREVASIYSLLVKRKKLLGIDSVNFGQGSERYSDNWRNELQNLLLGLLKSDPISAFVEIKRLIREEKAKIQIASGLQEVNHRNSYVELLMYVHSVLEETKLIKLVSGKLSGHIIGNRIIYKEVFRPIISPDFLFTRLMAEAPLDASELDTYSIGENADVSIFKLKNNIKYLYHLSPPEFKLDEDKYELLDIARRTLAEHKPKKEEFLDTEKIRGTFYNIGKDLIQELAVRKGINLKLKELSELANILVRYTVGFGLIEVLLNDEKVQDISINGPIGESPIFLVHQEFDECVTNIYPSKEDGEGWASKFRVMSGRPLDEANPVLDTELTLPNARARVAIISAPLNPVGLAYTLRRHRDDPWTLPLFIKNGMINPLSAGLISFLVDGNRSILVAGTRGSGKTSLLGSVLVEVMRKYKIITVEDTLELCVDSLRKLGYNIQPMKVRSALTKGGSELEADEGIRTSLRMGDSALIVGEIRSSIRGTEEVVIVENGITKRVQIKDLENKDIENIYVPTLDFNLKVKLSKLTAFVKHPQRNKLLRIKTRTGRNVTVTPDHSLFTSHNFKVNPIECKDLKIGSKIVLPSKLPCGYNDIKHLNLLEILDNARVENFEEPVRSAISKVGWKEATSICEIKSGDIYNYFRKQKTNMPINAFNKLMMVTNENPNLESLSIKNGTSNNLNVLLPVNSNFCRFLGYFISEGYYSKNGVVLSNNNEKIVSDIVNICKTEFKLSPYIRKTHGLGESNQISIHNSPLVKLLSSIGCGRTSKEKGIPAFIYGLSEEKIYSFLSGLYAGDGNFTYSKSSGNCARYYTISLKLAEDLMYLLLHVGIVARLHSRKSKGIGKNELYVVEFKDRNFLKKFLDKIDFIKYDKKIIEKNVSHSKFNDVSYDIEELEKHLKLIRKYRHLRKYNSCGKEFLRKIVADENTRADDYIKSFANGEFYLDEVKEIEEVNLEEGEHVYDLSVSPTQNFIGGFGGILLHNTEALALFEAMRVGALSNVVAGTIHGASPYGVYDRLVNDLKVPKTSFKATDIIIIANPVRSADGLHKKRRCLEIAEVRKNWENDPIAEGGFNDLMKYDAKLDTLKPSDNLINGDSDVLKDIASGVKEWVGNWDAVWDNITLRANIKQAIVEYANQTGNNAILEAPFVIRSNDVFHQICDEVREEVGSIDSKRVLFLWNEWVRNELKAI